MANQSDQPAAKDAPPTLPQAAVGASGTAKVSFTDAVGADVPLSSVEWTSSSNVTVEPDSADPTSAKVTATAPGRGSVKATAATANGASAEAAADFMVIETGTPVTGTIALTLPPPSKKAD